MRGAMSICAAALLWAGAARASDESGRVTAMAFSPDGGALCAALDEGFACWATASGRELFFVAEKRDNTRALAWFADGATLATANGDAGLKLWDARSGKAKRTISYKKPNEHHEVMGVAAAGDGTLAIVIRSGTTGTVEWRKQSDLSVTRSTDATCGEALAIAVDGKLACAGETGPLVWGKDGGAIAGADHNAQGDPIGAAALAWTVDGKKLHFANATTYGSFDPSSQSVDPSYRMADFKMGEAYAAARAIVSTSDGRLGALVPAGVAWYQLPVMKYQSLWPTTGGGMVYAKAGELLAIGQANAVAIYDAKSTSPRLLRTLAHGGGAAVAGGDPTVVDGSAGSGGAPPPPPPALAGGGSSTGAGAMTDVPPAQQQLAADVSVIVDNIVGKAFPERVSYANTFDDEQRASQQCDKAVADALAGGLAPTAKIAAFYNKRVPGLVKDPRSHSRSLLSLADVKTTVCGRMREIYLTAKAASAAYAAAQGLALAQRDHSITPAFNAYADAWASCSKVVAEARREGLAAGTMIPYDNFGVSSLPTPVSLADLDAKVCRAAEAQGGAITKKLKEIEDQKYRPYIAALSGDKKKLFYEKSFLDGSDWYGPGGELLRSPEAFKKASGWYYFVHDRNVWPERWKVEGWQFKGDKIAHTFAKEGVGSDPPDSAYP